MEREAMFYEVQDHRLHCALCPHNCIIQEGNIGICKVRKNLNNKLYSLNFGEVTSVSRDPIEKKPLYHFKPFSNILSVGSFGCNFTCDFCQNYSISQYKAQSQYIPPEKLLELCLSLENNVGVAFTYNEPSIWYEYVYECSLLLKEKINDISIVLVSNGYIQKEPLKKILPYIDAANIDLKAFSNKYYNEICRGRLEPVLESIKAYAKGCHLEITTLLVTGENDSLEEINKIAEFIGSIDKSIPMHLSRYFPTYKMSNPPTDISSMMNAYTVAKKHLEYVYLGNVQGIDNSTYCPKCGYKLIDRGNIPGTVNMNDNCCPKCRKKINIVL